MSVLLPSHNAAASLPAAIDSILSQSLDDLELLVVDDGSTDATDAVLATYQLREPRLRVLRHERCQGIVSALNDGLLAARGAFIARMDADDVSHPRRLAAQCEFLDSHAEIGLVACRVEFGGDRAAKAGYAAYVDWTNTLLDPDTIALNRFVESPFAHPSVMFRRELVERFGAYRSGAFPEDYELWLRWLDAGVRMAKLPEILFTWSDPPQRLSRTDARYSVRAFYECKAEYLARWLARHNPHHPDVIVWGAGRETRKRAELLAARGVRITAYVDIDPRKLGQVIHGRRVLDETRTPAPDACFVVSHVGSRGARDDIRQRLGSRGFVEGVHFIAAA